MNGSVGVDEDLLEGLDVGPVDLAQALSHQPVELLVGSLLGTTVWKKFLKFEILV